MAASSSWRLNLAYFRLQFGAALGNCSVVVKLICVTVLLGYLLSFSQQAVWALSVTPGYLLPPNLRIWTAFTHCFVEFHLWHVAADIVTVGLCAKLVEPLWGALEMLTFFAVVNLSVAILSVAFYLVIYAATFDPDILFHTHIHGLSGYVAGLAVAVKQIMPDHVLLKTPLGKMRNRNIPLNVLLLSLTLHLVGVLEGTYPCMFTMGVLSSWIYLRFFQPHTNGTRGDMAENFTFASFFPNVLQPPIAVVCNTIYRFLVKIKVCRKPVWKYDVGAPSSSITISLPGTDQHDAERRRQIALKALSERLSKNDSGGTWPSLTDEDETPKMHSSTPDKGKTVTFALEMSQQTIQVSESSPSSSSSVTSSASPSTALNIPDTSNKTSKT